MAGAGKGGEPFLFTLCQPSAMEMTGDQRGSRLGNEFSDSRTPAGWPLFCFICPSLLMIDLKGLPDRVVSALCHAAFIVPVHLAGRLYSFGSRAPHAVALPRYVAVQLSALTLAAIFSYVCYNLWGLETAAAAFIVIGLTFGVNFIVLKLWAFAHKG